MVLEPRWCAAFGRALQRNEKQLWQHSESLERRQRGFAYLLTLVGIVRRGSDLRASPSPTIMVGPGRLIRTQTF